MSKATPPKPAGKTASQDELARNKSINADNPDAEPKGHPTSDRYHAETAHGDGQDAHKPSKGKK